MTTSPAHRVGAVQVAVAAIALLLGRNASAQLETIDFDIPAQSADAALREFARQSGRQILFSFPLTAGRMAPAVRGRYSPEEAVALIADAIGLEVALVDARTITLLAPEVQAAATRSSPGAESPAQRSARVSALPGEGYRLEEIVVTAQRRIEAVQHVPVSIDVIRGNTMDRDGVRNVRDIDRVSTEVEIDAAAGQATVIGLRGMQQQGFAPTGDTLAAVHLDGAFLSSFWGLNGLMFDLDRVEVLAGPQGTLYGRNSAAGAVNLITRKPDATTRGNVYLEYGSFNTWRTGGGVSLALTPDFAVRIAGQRLSRDPLFSDGAGEQDLNGLRLSGLWSPTGVDELFFTVDHAQIDGTNDAGTLYAVDASARLPDGTIPLSVSDFAGSATLRDPYDNQPYNVQRGLVFSGNNEQTNRGVMAQYTRRFARFNATLQYSHRDVEGVARGTTRTPSQFSTQLLPNAVTSNSAELHLTSKGAGSLEWVAGLFYLDATNRGWNATPLTDNAPDPDTGIDVSWCPCSSGFYPNSGSMYSYATFGQLTWIPLAAPRLRFTAGLRYTYDWKDATLGYWATTASGARPIFAFGVDHMRPAVRELFTGVPDLAAGDNDRTWEGLQYRLGLQFDRTANSMVYSSIATGYKSGGLTYGPTPELKPENLFAFEVGTKNRFLDETLEFNAAAWWYTYTDLEVNVQRALGFSFQLPNGTFQDSTTSTASAGKVYLAGLSADAAWNFSPADRLALSFTYVYSRISDGKEVSPSGQVNVVFNEGERIGNSPAWQALLRYSHAFALRTGGLIEPQIKYQWQGEKYDAGLYREQAYFTDNRNPPETAIPARGLLDLSVRFTSPARAWDVTAYVNNVTDELNIRNLNYNANPANASTTFGHTTALLGDPRIFGIIFNARFE